MDSAVFQTIQDAAEGNFPGGEIIDYGLDDKGLSLAPFGRFDGDVPQSVKDEVESAQQGIIDGDIKVPDKPQQRNRGMAEGEAGEGRPGPARGPRSSSRCAA